MVMDMVCIDTLAGGDDDDDDYFNFDDGDGDGGNEGFFRTVLKQLYDENSIKAVLQEWFHTLGTLPFFIGQLVEMRRFSSAELYRILSMDIRPNITRAVTRSLPPSVCSKLAAYCIALNCIQVPCGCSCRAAESCQILF